MPYKKSRASGQLQSYACAGTMKPYSCMPIKTSMISSYWWALDQPNKMTCGGTRLPGNRGAGTAIAGTCSSMHTSISLIRTGPFIQTTPWPYRRLLCYLNESGSTIAGINFPFIKTTKTLYLPPSASLFFILTR